MTKPRAFRHYCGELVFAEIFIAPDGETIPAFFPKTDREGVGVPVHNCPGCREILNIDFCGSPYLVEPMPYEVAARTENHRHCSNCWQMDWEILPATSPTGDDIGNYLLCRHCREDTIGYVSYQFVLTQQSEDYLIYSRNREAISEALNIPLPEPIRTIGENLKDLGF